MDSLDAAQLEELAEVKIEIIEELLRWRKDKSSQLNKKLIGEKLDRYVELTDV